MTKNTAEVVVPETGTIEDGLTWRDVSYGNETYRIRQVRVEEADENYDAAYDEKKDRLNWRFNNRLNLSTSIMSPPTSVDDIGKWANAKLHRLLRAYEEINGLREADTEGN